MLAAMMTSVQSAWHERYNVLLLLLLCMFDIPDLFMLLVRFSPNTQFVIVIVMSAS